MELWDLARVAERLRRFRDDMEPVQFKPSVHMRGIIAPLMDSPDAGTLGTVIDVLMDAKGEWLKAVRAPNRTISGRSASR
ncbi:hypothetical protein ABAZ39_11550 [Azospirillum argentinense]|uniref:Uncharacterized protein n=2 Tax=Azospirillum argentinense TaxID=2970906 RepID=A0A060DIL2_9PROT|nr:hypothetical protein ABAZ39_11550 [Azospirillum argentinense]